MSDDHRIRAVHLDLKGVPPTPRRLLELLPIFAAAGYNAILVEWEDMFPWSVDPRFRCETPYTHDDLTHFHEQAQLCHLEIIPLVQCLGHMETPLAIPDYAHLREVPHRSDVLNPLAQGARLLVEAMVLDVLAHSPQLRYFHLGGDEAWTFGTHPDTKAYIEKHGKGALYLHHVEPLLQLLKSRGIRPILWHDMMIHWEPAALDKIAGLADLCVWGYQGTHAQTTSHWQTRYLELFQHHNIRMWGATAYKGAESPSEDLPDPAARLLNCQAWADAATRYDMAGVIATAWSRFSVDRLQDSPIDSALDVLVLCGQILKDGKPPANGLADCRKILQTMNERVRSEACYAPMKQLAGSRANFWKNVQFLREGIVTATLDLRRRSSGHLVSQFLHLTADLRRANEAADEARTAFAGLIPSLWIERYLAERVAPMQEESRTLGPRVQQLDPAGYAAEVPADTSAGNTFG